MPLRTRPHRSIFRSLRQKRSRSIVVGGLGVLAALCAPAPSAAQRVEYPPAAAVQSATVPARPIFSGVLRDGVAFEAHEVAHAWPPVSAITALPDGRVLVADVAGRIRAVSGGHADPRPLLSWPGVVVHGMAADRAFLVTRWVYLAATIDVLGEPSTVVIRVREAMGKLSEPAVLLNDLPGGPDAGGGLHVGPDGDLYLGTADRPDPSAAQDLGDAAGKILRLTADGRPGSRLLGLGYVHAWGFSDARVFAWDGVGGHLWQLERSADGVTTEINRVDASTNYGWAGGGSQGVAPRSPRLQWTPGARPLAAVVYEGAGFPALRGDLLVAAADRDGLVRVPAGQLVSPTGALEACFHEAGAVQALTVASDGTIYLVARDTAAADARAVRLLRVVPREATGGAGSSAGTR